MTRPEDKPQRSAATGPQTLDLLAGRAVRRMRERAGLSRAALGRACGVSGAQVEKYELGTNRMSLSRFQAIAQALGTDPVSLMATLAPPPAAPSPAPADRRRKAAELAQLAMRMDEETLDHVLALGHRLAS